MEKEFIPYEQALALKELGFDEKCFLYIYTGDTGNNVDHIIETKPSLAKNHNLDSLCISKPTFSQAFRFFREKYNIEHINRPVKKFETDKSREISFCIDGYFISNLRFTTDKTYEEAELECLVALINIVKKNEK